MSISYSTEGGSYEIPVLGCFQYFPLVITLVNNCCVTNVVTNAVLCSCHNARPQEQSVTERDRGVTCDAGKYFAVKGATKNYILNRKWLEKGLFG